MIQLTGIHVGGTILDAVGQSLPEASIFGGEDGCAFLVANLSVSGTTKDAGTRFSLLGHISAAAAKNLSGTFQQVRLDINSASPHRIDPQLSVGDGGPDQRQPDWGRCCPTTAFSAKSPAAFIPPVTKA